MISMNPKALGAFAMLAVQEAHGITIQGRTKRICLATVNGLRRRDTLMISSVNTEQRALNHSSRLPLFSNKCPTYPLYSMMFAMRVHVNDVNSLILTLQPKLQSSSLISMGFTRTLLSARTPESSAFSLLTRNRRNSSNG